MKLMQVLYGLFTAGEVAYYSYLYVEVPREHFKKIASFTRAATLVGKFVSFLLAQLLYSFRVMDYYDQHLFSFISVCVAFVIPLVLPWPKHSEIFHRTGAGHAQKDENGTIELDETERSKTIDAQIQSDNRNHVDMPSSKGEIEVKHKVTSSADISVISTRFPNHDAISASDVQKEHHICKQGFSFMWREIKTIYNSRIVVIWSVWWAIASCGNFQVLNYVQNLWATISLGDSPSGDEDVYNGAVEAVSTLLGD